MRRRPLHLAEARAIGACHCGVCRRWGGGPLLAVLAVGLSGCSSMGIGIGIPVLVAVLFLANGGIVPLADSALRWRQEVSVPLITGGTAPGLILPGYLIEVQEPGETWRGLVRHLSLDENMPEFTQTLTVDRFQ